MASRHGVGELGSAGCCKRAQLSLLANWAPACIVDTISLMTPALVKHPSVAAYVRRTLDAHPAEEVAFFLPQLVQALRYQRPCVHMH